MATKANVSHETSSTTEAAVCSNPQTEGFLSGAMRGKGRREGLLMANVSSSPTSTVERNKLANHGEKGNHRKLTQALSLLLNVYFQAAMHANKKHGRKTVEQWLRHTN